MSSELWDEVIDCMKLRAGDKVPVIRISAVRALSRFASDCENSDILDLFLDMLPLEQTVVSSSIDSHTYMLCRAGVRLIVHLLSPICCLYSTCRVSLFNIMSML